MRLPTLLTLGVALLSAHPLQADIYAYVDSKGVRHISNVPNDPRYQLVMRTPQYAAPAKSTSDDTQAMGALDMTPRFTRYSNVGGGWRVITPHGRPTAVDLSYASLGWTTTGRGIAAIPGAGGKRKPFSVNEANRAQFAPHINAIARQYRLEPELLFAVISAESAFDPKAVSSAGARGLMQLMPDTAKRFGVQDPFDPIANLHGGARYLRFLLDQFKSVNLAVAGYNAGEGAVARYGNTIPPYRETQVYVERVLSFYNHYRLASN